MKNQVIYIFLILIVWVLFSGCAERVLNQDCAETDIYGFLGGLWHGIIAPFGLIAMLFKNDVIVYASCNNGFWYAFGFLLGSGGWGILAGKSRK